MRSKENAVELECRRRLAIARLDDGYSTKQVAELLGVHQRTVQKWKTTHDQQGEAGLAAKPHQGRPPRLTSQQTRTVLSWFLKSPREFGYSTDLWTARRVREWIREHFGITYHSRYFNRWLTRRWITPQKPARRARQRDDQQIQDWVDQQWPELLEKGPNAMPTWS